MNVGNQTLLASFQVANLNTSIASPAISNQKVRQKPSNYMGLTLHIPFSDKQSLPVKLAARKSGQSEAEFV